MYKTNKVIHKKLIFRLFLKFWVCEFLGVCSGERILYKFEWWVSYTIRNMW
jgi:hypothetical protein